MEQPSPVDIDQIEGITLHGDAHDRAATLRLLRTSLALASELLPKAKGSVGLSPIAGATMAALNTATALVASVAPMCNLEPPPTDIEVKVDGNGDMIYRCQHIPPHEWDMIGKLKLGKVFR